MLSDDGGVGTPSSSVRRWRLSLGEGAVRNCAGWLGFADRRFAGFEAATRLAPGLGRFAEA